MNSLANIAPWLHQLPWPIVALAALVTGFGAGLVHFRTLRAVAGRLVAGDMAAIPIQLVRLAALGGFLFLVALAGPLALLAATAGILLARKRELANAEGAP